MTVAIGIMVTTRDGRELRLDVADAPSLMTPLRDAGTGIAGTCGGAASCGTCHIVVAAEWVDRLPPPNEEEADMLEALADVMAIDRRSRLSCQIRPTAALDGLSLTIAPED